MDKSREFLTCKDFAQHLEHACGEREVAAYLKDRTPLLYWALCRSGGHARFAFKEFPLGSRFKVDFVILNSYSGMWEVFFIELEPVDAGFFTRAGTPAKRMLGAIKQVDDWREYFTENKEQVRSDLVRWAKAKDLLGYTSPDYLRNASGDELADPHSFLSDEYVIFVGRRNRLTAESAKRKAKYRLDHSVDIISYDRLSDVSKQRYKNPNYWLAKDC